MNESASYRRIEKVIGHIDRHHERQPDLGELAKVAGLSVFHFSREFRRWAGLSPTRYLRTLSLSAAKRELNELQAFHTGQSIEQIEKDSDRDRWFTAQEALEYGMVDHVVSRATMTGTENPVTDN